MEESALINNTVYDYRLFFYEKACDNYEDVLVHCYENDIPLEVYAKSLIDTNPGTIIHVDFSGSVTRGIIKG